MSLEERLLSMQQCFLLKLDIIQDNLDTVIETISLCDIINRPTVAGLLDTSEAVRFPLSFWLSITDIILAQLHRYY